MISEQALPRVVKMVHTPHRNPGQKHSCINAAMKNALKHLAENVIDDIFFGGFPVCEIVDMMRHHDRNNHRSAEVRQEVKGWLREHDFWEDDGTTEAASDVCDACRVS